MELQTNHQGGGQPFERERQLFLRCIPEGASIRAATATVVPISADDEGRFAESIEFVGNDGDWGASKRTSGESPTAEWVEVNLHARRRLSAVSGTGLAGRVLLVDLGGGFTTVDENGGLGGDPGAVLDSDAPDLPGLTVSGVRINGTAATSPDITTLRIESPPSNVTIALEGGPTFWTHFGDLVDPVISPDFSTLLQAAIDSSDVEHGHHVVSMIVHSDSIARLDITLDIDFVITTSATPVGVDQVSVPYGFGSVADASASALSISVPPGSIAAARSTTGRVQGAFQPTGVVLGSAGPVDIAGTASVTASASHAQPFAPEEATIATSVDVLVAAITASAEIAVDLVDDLDGKPGQTSLLSAVATRTITRDDAPDSTWINVALREEVELIGGQRYWLVTHARQGTVAWAFKEESLSPSLHATSNGGLSWRTIVDGPSRAHFRLRHTTATFNMPLELRVDAGAGAVPVDLQRFAAAGRIDFSLDFPGVADAINSSLESVGANSRPLAEHIHNGKFDQWFRLGKGLQEVKNISSEVALLPAFSTDGSIVYLAASNAFEAFGAYCGTELYSTQVDLGRLTQIAVDPTSRIALIASLGSNGSRGFSSTLTLIDVTAGHTIGSPIGINLRIAEVEPTADGSGLFLLGSTGSGSDEPQSTIVRLDWAELRRATSNPDAFLLPKRRTVLKGLATALTVGPDGSAYVATSTESDTTSLEILDARLGPDATRPTPPLPHIGQLRDLAFVTSGAHLVALGESTVTVIATTTTEVLASHPLSDEGRSLAADPIDDSVFVLMEGSAATLAASGLSIDSTEFTVAKGVTATISAPGSRMVIMSARESPSPDASRVIRVIRVGLDMPADWDLTAGRIAPDCAGTPRQSVARLGVKPSKKEPIIESAISQVVPVVADTSYRFSFDAGASTEFSTAEVLWRSADCGADRIDKIDIQPSEPERVTLHPYEATLRSPPDAVSAEVRFHTAEGTLSVDSVSLFGTNEAVANSRLQPSGGGLAAWAKAPTLAASSGTSGATVLFNGGSDTSLTQLVSATGTRYKLDAIARTTTEVEGAAIAIDFVDELGTVVSDQVNVPLSSRTFDRVAAAGDVPSNAVSAHLSIVIPASASVTVESLSMEFFDPVLVSLEFISEAPGDLIISGVEVGIDAATPQRPPIPELGLCPATAPGSKPGEDAKSCHCPACGSRETTTDAVAVLTAAGRPATLAKCARCGQPLVMISGQPTASGASVAVAPFTVPAARPVLPSAREPRFVSTAPITTINGIGPSRARDLERLGIDSLSDLARAAVTDIASLRGVSLRQAERMIADAQTLLRREGTLQD